MKTLNLLKHKKTREVYCPYELAELLKQAGFNYECEHCFELSDKDNVKNLNFTNSHYDDRIACPTLNCARQWLLDEKNLPIEMIHSYVKNEWAACVNGKYHWGKTYSAVLAEGILQHLKKLLLFDKLDVTFI